MRKILFRAKSIEKSNKGKWVQGFYFIKQNTNTIDGFPVTHHISDFPPFGFRIDPETLGQYTGLKDKNGGKIFENSSFVINQEKYTVVYKNARYILKHILTCDIIDLYENHNLGEILDE